VGGEAVILDPDLAVLAVTAGGEEVAMRARTHLESKRRLTDPAAPGSALLEPAGRWTGWLLIRPVAAGGDRLGHLCVSLDHPPENLDPVIVEQAAIVCALELTKQRAVLEAHTRVRSDFIWDFLDGNVSDDAEAMVRARYLGYAFPLRLRVALISVDGFTAWVRQSGADADSVHRRWSSIVRAVERLAVDHSPARPLAARRGSVIALVVPCATSREGDQEAAAAAAVVAARRLLEAVIGGLQDAHPDLRFAAGVSACCPLSGDLRQAGSQAASALASLSVMAPGKSVALFDDLGVVRFLLAPGDRQELSAFAHAVLGPVLDYDARHSAELVDTVDAYLATDCSLARAAERLSVHPKTVRYRLDRAEALSGRDFSRQQDRFDAQLAITIIRAVSLGTPPGD
jgi:sugar diacid utilization regulator